MADIFGGLFDLNDDGKLDIFEKALEYDLYESIMERKEEAEDDNDDFDSDEFDSDEFDSDDDY